MLQNVSFTFFSSPKESNKEKAPETISLAFSCARCAGRDGATLQDQTSRRFRSAPRLDYSISMIFVFTFLERLLNTCI
jgi:hypothetical protein